MAIPSNQVDLLPSTPGNTTGLHVHVPAGVSASTVNNPSDAPSVSRAAVPNSAGKAVAVTVAPGIAPCRFANPA